MQNPVIEQTTVIEGRCNGPATVFGARPTSGSHVTIEAPDGGKVTGLYIRREEREWFRSDFSEWAFRNAPNDACDVIVPFAFYVPLQ